jgi:hypothetical protein
MSNRIGITEINAVIGSLSLLYWANIRIIFEKIILFFQKNANIPIILRIFAKNMQL